MRYDKLVRDKIPEIVKKNGQKPFFHIANNKEYEEKLLDKLKEEVFEFIKDKKIDEMADIFEVITAINSHNNWSLEKVIDIQKENRVQRGGFKNRIILDKVE